ncbi:Tetraacyldisaccharide 4'-kinase LpxK [Helicobacter sp. NHP19-003]|uniref:Tetraacyldisaccharide 4'-kinase n=1 Tax=Helicobacter gastrocanis TaxID=2849641 RepID=A0ABM7SAR1_9HELI|nr:tetraacyldisaccharide 4'-kinase [Helicobacter sp. NHP19-003]BCZ17692.1 Tetraacyldisaccharide 4'-kinase LpxK [Helicobacter sp. NHP19-003]
MTWLERYFYAPTLCQKALAYALSPLSFVYEKIATIKRQAAPLEDFKIPIISVGNLVAGGSGKTPFILALAQVLAPLYQTAVVSRGYGRASRGLVVVSEGGKVLVEQNMAGDEAFLLASKLDTCGVVVSEKRKEGVLEAKKMGAQVVLLDDGFRFNFKKLNILLKPQLQPYFDFCLPSGVYRESPKCYALADLVVQEGVDYTRHTQVLNPTERMLLVTAIANPTRLDPFLPPVVGRLYFKDHARFSLKRLEQAYTQHNATSLLVTAKDTVKLTNCPLPLSLLDLRLEIAPKILQSVLDYLAR